MKWRKFKKVFKKKIRPSMIGLTMTIDTDLGNTCVKILDVKASPAGGRQVQYSFISAPVDSVPIQAYHNDNCCSDKGFSLSFEIPTPSKELVDYLFN